MYYDHNCELVRRGGKTLSGSSGGTQDPHCDKLKSRKAWRYDPDHVGIGSPGIPAYFGVHSLGGEATTSKQKAFPFFQLNSSLDLI